MLEANFFHALSKRDHRAQVPSLWFGKLWRRCEQSWGPTGFVDTEALNSSVMTRLFWGHHKTEVSGLQWVARTFNRVMGGRESESAPRQLSASSRERSVFQLEAESLFLEKLEPAFTCTLVRGE